jgi:alcohol dehydrogenase (cytochrome c)
MRIVSLMAICVMAAIGTLLAQTASPGRASFERLCARCHGADGRGGEMGPGIVSRLVLRTDEELSALVRGGLPAKGMPGNAIADADLRALVSFARTLRPGRGEAPARMSATMADGSALNGVALNRSATDVQLLADGGGLHLLRRASAAAVGSGETRRSPGEVGGDAWRRVTSQTDWSTYHGDRGGNRYSTLDQINRTTVGRLAPAWVFPLPDASRLQVTPLVVEGVMYVTNANECYALDAGSGRRIWHYQRARTKGLAGDAASGINRGVAVDGDRLFMVTDHAHLIALNRFTGDLVWETPMADWRQNYGATSAPLVVGNLVVSGISGGDEGVRGFLAAFDRTTGKEVWRFWTVPAPGEPGSETWRGTVVDHRCGAAWLTGTYDPDLDTLYWPTGNPCPDYDGAERQGDNLYADSILALDPVSGRLKWHFQYTPHDLWDWDAQQPPVLVDTAWEGRPRKLLLHANRNGFFYVLDRTTGALLLAKPFVKKLTWAREIGADGRPVLNPDQTPTAEGRTVCPAVEGATNWFSTSFNPSTGLYYVQALEKCTVYARTPETWKAGQSFYGGSTRRVSGQPGQKVLRAIDVRTGAIRWEMPQTGPASSWGGTLATAGGLVFVGEDSGALMAVDAATGAPLWQFQTNVLWKASPMTYVFDGRQHIAVAAGPNIMAFRLID